MSEQACPYGAGDHRELIRQAQQQGREDNADHAMCYVHGSEALEALVRQAKADALREAADALGPHVTMRRLDERESYDQWTDYPVDAWLRLRARALVSDEPGETL